MTTNDVFDMIEDRCTSLLSLKRGAYWFNDVEELAVDEGLIKLNELAVLVGHVIQQAGVSAPPGQVTIKSMQVAVSVIIPLSGDAEKRKRLIRTLNDALDTLQNNLGVDPGITGSQWFATDPYDAYLVEVNNALPITGPFGEWTGYRILIEIGFTR